MWHEFFRGYVADPMMSSAVYSYDYQSCQSYFDKMMSDITRRYFAIVADKKVLGQIYLKNIDWYAKTSCFGISMIDDSAKGKGYGTKAIKLLMNYAFVELGMETIFADTVLQNTRSQYVLEKLGFIFTHENCNFKYYELRRGEYCLPNFPKEG